MRNSDRRLKRRLSEETKGADVDMGGFGRDGPRQRLNLYLWAFSAGIALFCGRASSSEISDTKAHLVQEGVTPTLIYDGSVVADTAGGTRRGKAYVGNLRLQLSLDGKRLFDMPGFTIFSQVLSIHGGQPSQFVGDAQGVNSYAAKSALRLYEAWGQYSSPNGRWSFLAGRYDLSSEFYRLASSGLFLNSSFGTGPEFAQSGIAGPSIFPDTSIGARLTFKPTLGILIRTAIMHGAPVDRIDSESRFPGQEEGWLAVSEVAVLTRPATDDVHGLARFRTGRGANFPAYDGKVAVGLWRYSGTFADLSLLDAMGHLIVHKGSQGAYALVDQQLFQSIVNPSKRIAGFLQYGVGDGRVNRFASYLSAGVVSAGLIDHRPDDEIGVAINHARNGSHYVGSQNAMALPVTAAESAIEVTYLVQVNSWLAIQPDIQYVIHPGTTPTRANATVLQVHLQLML